MQQQQQPIMIFLDFLTCLVFFLFVQVTSTISKMGEEECVFTTFEGINLASFDIF